MPKIYPFYKSWLKAPNHIMVQRYYRKYYWHYRDEDWYGNVTIVSPIPTEDQLIAHADRLRQKYNVGLLTA